MTRHQRRKKAKKLAIERRNTETVEANLSQPQERKPQSKIAQGYRQVTGFRHDHSCKGGLHRNNAVPRKHRVVALLTTPEREAIVRLRVAPFYRADLPILPREGATTERGNRPTFRDPKTKRIVWNNDSFVDNLALRTKPTK